MSNTNSKLSLGGDLNLRDIWDWIETPYPLSLKSTDYAKINECRTTLEQINSEEKPVYGVSTGFGHLQNKWIPPEKQGQLQLNLIRSHAIGTGGQVPHNQIRVALLLLINSLSQGHSGIRAETVDRLLYFLNNNLIPVTYSIGSLGASGDLAPLAHLALTLIGEGFIDEDGRRRPTSEVLEERGLLPIELQAKEGLALINGTHFVTSYGIILLKEAYELIILSCVASSLSLEALRGTDTPFKQSIANLRKHNGHNQIARIFRSLLSGSQIIENHRDPRVDHKTQDAYAFRCIPQVMGAVWDAFGYLQKTLKIEINSITDNPLIFSETGEILSAGNFHAEPLGLPLETCSMALVEIANMTEARIARLVSPSTPELPSFLANSPGLESGYMIAHYTVAAIVNRLRGLAHPNITDNIPVSGTQEDHVSMAMNTATRVTKILKLVREVVVFELIMSIRGLNLVKHPPSSPILEEILDQVNTEIEFHTEDHIIHEVLEQYNKFVQNGIITKIVSDAMDLQWSFID